MNVIEINNLTKYYGKERGIIDISFNVEEKEIFGFIGPNGAGKSTTLRTILGEVQRMCDRVAIIKEGRIIQLDKIRALQENNYKKIKVQTLGNLDQKYFEIDGVSNLDLNDNLISFIFKGNINSIMQKIADIEIANVWIEEPDLEEIFLHFYEKGA